MGFEFAWQAGKTNSLHSMCSVLKWLPLRCSWPDPRPPPCRDSMWKFDGLPIREGKLPGEGEAPCHVSPGLVLAHEVKREREIQGQTVCWTSVTEERLHLRRQCTLKSRFRSSSQSGFAPFFMQPCPFEIAVPRRPGQFNFNCLAIAGPYPFAISAVWTATSPRWCPSSRSRSR